MQRLDHPNVLGLLGMTIARSGILAMVTDFLPLGSVFALLQAEAQPKRPPEHALSSRPGAKQTLTPRLPKQALNTPQANT
eukprot:6085623-Prymnesium_polylepis.1